MLVIGSYAAKHWIPSFRDHVDIDLWMSQDEFTEFYNYNRGRLEYFKPQKTLNKYNASIHGQKLEIGVYDNAESPEFLIEAAQFHRQTTEVFGFNFIVASLKSLLFIKRSHLNFPVKWNKHIEDYHVLKNVLLERPALAILQHDDELDNAYKSLYQKAETRFEQRRKPNLNVSNDKFFNASQNAVHRKYNHDDIHEAVSFFEEPMYTKLKEDPNSARCSKKLWDMLPRYEKMRAVKEEACVIALERQLIPIYDDLMDVSDADRKEAFDWALKRICTTLTSGWFRDFAIDNWEICRKYLPDYPMKFQIALNKDEVRLYNG